MKFLIFLLIVNCSRAEESQKYLFNNESSYRLTLFLNENPIISSATPFHLDFGALGIPEKAEGRLVLERPNLLPVFGHEAIVVGKKEGRMILAVDSEKMGQEVELDRSCVFNAAGASDFKNMKTLIPADSVFLKERLSALFSESDEWKMRDHDVIKKVFGDIFFRHLNEKMAGKKGIGGIKVSPFNNLKFIEGKKTILTNLKREFLRFDDLSAARPLSVTLGGGIGKFVFDGLTFSKGSEGGWRILTNDGWVEVFKD